MSKIGHFVKLLNVTLIIAGILGGILPLSASDAVAGEARSIYWERLQEQRIQAQYNLIKAVQRKLIEQGYDLGPVDGFNGPRTQKALKAYQQDHGLVVDGIPGDQTLKSLGLR